MNIERKRRDPPCVGRIRLRTRILNVPSAPRFFARKTSAMPPAPSRRTISKLAISFGGAGELFIVEGDRQPVYIGWPSRRGVGGRPQGRQWGSSKVRGGPAPERTFARSSAGRA